MADQSAGAVLPQPRKRGRPPKNSKPLQQPSNSQLNSRAGAPAVDEKSINGDVPVQVVEMASESEAGEDVEMAEVPNQVNEIPPQPQPPGAARRKPGRPKKSPATVLTSTPAAAAAASAAPESEMKTVAHNLPLKFMEDPAENVKDAPFMDSVVKVFCVHTEPNFSLPWQRKRQFSSNSSGFIIGGRKLLTNAHSVEHHTQVKVKKRGSDTKYLASVLAIGTECDIALLTVNDEEFWESAVPVEFGSLPRLQDAITVVGYPIGGDTISVTSGVVSRIEVTSYVHGATELLGVQIDAAINAGNSGGPAFNDRGQCVGIAFQSLKHEDAENIGYVIPTPVISHFITDYDRTGGYTGLYFYSRLLNYDYDAPVTLLDKYLHALARTDDEQLVVVSQVLVADVNIGYEDIVNTQVVAFNGTSVRSLKQLAEMVENCKDEFLRFDLEHQQVVVLERETAKAATPDILATHCIPCATSNDLRSGSC